MHIAENTFAEITFLEDVGPNRDDIITCPPDQLPAGYADRKNSAYASGAPRAEAGFAKLKNKRSSGPSGPLFRQGEGWR
jgi:hypothetical protein